jgi:hypothetical protein
VAYLLFAMFNASIASENAPIASELGNEIASEGKSGV